MDYNESPSSSANYCKAIHYIDMEIGPKMISPQISDVLRINQRLRENRDMDTTVDSQTYGSSFSITAFTSR